jgi:CubicO group peptidase (beta-lactamase class C family)
VARAKAPLAGFCEPRFAPVRDAMVDNYLQYGELGASVCIVVDGRVVVDLWGGFADARRTRPWQADTLVCVFSVGKALAGLSVLRLVEVGELKLDAPLGRWWPELAGGEATLRELLSHRAGLPAISRRLPADAYADWRLVTDALADQEPWWRPGSAHGYHVHTFGFLVGELVRRATGGPIGTLLDREIARPLAADVQFGLRPTDRRRRAEFIFTEDMTALDRTSTAPARQAALRERAYLNPPGATGLGTVNTVAWMDAELPSANLHATARGIAFVYAALLDGRVLHRDTLAEAITESSAGDDLVLGRPSRFGLGFQLTQPERPLGPAGRSFGHFGAGGSLGFADPDAGVAFGYVTNRGGPRWRNPRNRALIDALYTILEE